MIGVHGRGTARLFDPCPGVHDKNGFMAPNKFESDTNCDSSLPLRSGALSISANLHGSSTRHLLFGFAMPSALDALSNSVRITAILTLPFAKPSRSARRPTRWILGKATSMPVSTMKMCSKPSRSKIRKNTRLFEELSKSHPAFQFFHCHGLGVLAMGEASAVLAPLFESSDADAEQIRAVYAALGGAHSVPACRGGLRKRTRRSAKRMGGLQNRVRSL
jgi:hypothetical protein